MLYASRIALSGDLIIFEHINLVKLTKEIYNKNQISKQLEANKKKIMMHFINLNE